MKRCKNQIQIYWSLALFQTFLPVVLRNRFIFSGLEMVLSHTSKSYIASHYGLFSMNIYILVYVWRRKAYFSHSLKIMSLFGNALVFNIQSIIQSRTLSVCLYVLLYAWIKLKILQNTGWYNSTFQEIFLIAIKWFYPIFLGPLPFFKNGMKS